MEPSFASPTRLASPQGRHFGMALYRRLRMKRFSTICLGIVVVWFGVSSAGEASAAPTLSRESPSATNANNPAANLTLRTDLGPTVHKGETMHAGDTITAGHWRLVLDLGGHLIGIKTSTGQHCYSFGAAGANARAVYELTGTYANHFVLYRSNGDVAWESAADGPPDPEHKPKTVSIYNGNFHVGLTFIHGPAPACSA